MTSYVGAGSPTDLRRSIDDITGEEWNVMARQWYPRTDAEAIADRIAPPLDRFEERVHDVLFELATLIVEARRGN